MKKYFTGLDAIRGIAALQVAYYHLTRKMSFENLAGYLAVDLFFVLSGFVIAHSYLYKDRFNYSEYAVKRFARLWPLNVFTLLCFLIYFSFSSKGFPKIDSLNISFFQNLFLLNDLGLSPHYLTWNIPSWSVSVEFWVNLFFLIFITRYTKTIFILFISLFCYGIIYTQHGYLSHETNTFFISFGLWRGMAGFTLGIVAYRVYKWVEKNINNVKVSLISTLEILLIVSTFSLMNFTLPGDSKLDFWVVPLFFLMMVVFPLELGVVSKFFRYTRLNFIGLISYSIYLNHYLIKTIMVSNIAYFSNSYITFVMIVGYFLTVISISYFTYIYIENTTRRAIPGLVNFTVFRRTNYNTTIHQ